MSHLKRTLAAALALAVAALPICPTLAAAADGKEEVIYANLSAGGNLKKAYVVNSFGPGNVTDYGNYSSVRMLNTDDAIKQQGDAVHFSSDAQRVYYEGTMAAPKLPWLVDISYTLDGKAVTPHQLAGKSGALEIHFKITENPACSGSFYDDYALQASVTLDTDLAQHIDAPDATIANVGSDKQLTYTVLPGKGLDTTISADVEDFTMDAIAINGVRLNLDVDVDTSEMKEQVVELINATVALDNGAVALADGARTLESGSQDMTTGTAKLSSGIASLDSGVTTLQQGLTTMQQGLNALDAQSNTLNSGSAAFATALAQVQTAVDSASGTVDEVAALVNSATAIKSAIDELLSGAGTLQNALGSEHFKAKLAQHGVNIDAVMTQNSQASATMTRDLAQLQALADTLAATPGMEEEAAVLQQMVSDMSGMSILLESNNTVMTSTTAYLDGAADQVGPLVSGLGNLQNAFAQFHAAIGQLAESLSSMGTKMDALSEALGKLNSNYATLDNGIHAYTSGVSQLASGYGAVMQGVASLSSASKELLAGSGTLDDGSADLYDGVTTLADGAQTLVQGTGTLRSETDGIDARIDEEIESMTAGLSASDTPVVSFASSKNSDVESVQFVLQTAAIATGDDKKPVEEKKEDTSLWQKFLNLFK